MRYSIIVIADHWTLKDLHHVLNIAWCARAKWYHIGLGLQLTAGDLDSIRMTHHDNVDNCFTETVKTWLKMGKNTNSKFLAKALGQPCVNYGHLAESILVPDCKIPEPALQQDDPETQDLFPYLQTDSLSLSVEEATRLKVQLNDDAEQIMTKFSTFILSITKSFKRRGLSPEELASHILHICPRDSFTRPLLDASDKLLDVKSIDRIMLELRRSRYLTFFNYHILEYVVEELGTDSEKKIFESYLKSFKAFCKRSLFEVPQYLFDKHPSNGIRFAVKVSDDFKNSFQSSASGLTTLESVPSDQATKVSSKTLGLSVNDSMKVLGKLAKVLDVKVGTFCITDAKPGCTTLVVSIPKSILPQMSANPNVAALEASGISLLCGPPGKPQAVEVTTDSVVLTWTKPDYEIRSLKKYQVYFRSASSKRSEWEIVETTGLEERIAVTDLRRRGHMFVFKVRALSDSVEGLESEESEYVVLNIPPTNIANNNESLHGQVRFNK